MNKKNKKEINKTRKKEKEKAVLQHITAESEPY